MKKNNITQKLQECGEKTLVSKNLLPMNQETPNQFPNNHNKTKKSKNIS